MSAVYPPAPNMVMMRNQSQSERRKRRPLNTGSRMLTQSENDSLFKILPYDNYSLCAAVAEILQGQPEDRRWIRLHRGVVSLVKDYQSRAYYLRFFDIVNSTILWDLKMYKNFSVIGYGNCPNLLSFESDDGRVYGLNFASADEAVEFKGHVDKRNEQEKKANIGQKDPRQAPPAAAPAYAPSGVSVPSRPPAQPMAFNSSGVTAGSVAPSATIPQEKDSRGFFGMKKSKKKDKKPKIRKEDISNPTNFEHKAHVGWDQDNGFSNTVFDPNHIDDSVAQIIRAAGMDTAGMDKKTIKFVYDFIDNYQRENQVPVASISNFAPPSYKQQQAPLAPLNQWGSLIQGAASPSQSTSAGPPPPAPSRGPSLHQQQQASYPSPGVAPARPPPPPPSMGPRVQRPLPQVPSVDSPYRPGAAPPPPPPPPQAIYVSSSAPPPPPPPPPPPVSGGPPPPPAPPSDLAALPPAQSNRGNLLAEIQAGKSLRTVGASTNNNNKVSSGDNRGDVMNQIRQGATLKHVDVSVEAEKRKSNQAGVSEMPGIAGALARALAERRQNMGSDESDSDDSEEKNEWSD